MKIAVIGAGITGISTAYALTAAGHSVTVFDKSSAAAEGASFAPNGLMAPSLLQTLAISACDTGQWRRVRNNANLLSLRSGARWHDLQWLWQWSQMGSTEHILPTIQNLQALYTYSSDCMRSITSHANFDMEQSNGHVAVLRTPADEALWRPRLTLLKQCGVIFQELSREECLKFEPALSLSTNFLTGLYFPNDQVANCRQFAMLLKAELLQKKVGFQFNAKVQEIRTSPRLSVYLEGESQARDFDHIVVCTGANIQALLQPLGSHLTGTILHNYSLTLPIRESTLAPRSAVFDTQSNITVHRLGQRVRVCGGAELGGHAEHKNKKIINQLYQTLETFFPGAAQHTASAQIFKAGQWITRTGMPRIGASRIPGVWINAGHGVHGWGTACGSAQLIADLIAKKEPEIATQAFQG